jgi:hypothetical protein
MSVDVDRASERIDGDARPAVRPGRPVVIAAAPAVVLAGAVRLAYLMSTEADFNADEAATGVMVHHILRGKMYTFYAGQHYGGSLEQYLQAFTYLIFRLPQNPLTLRLPLVALAMTTTALVYACARRMLPTQRQAVLAAILFAVAPWFNVLGGVTSLGFYVVGTTLGMGAFHCALRLGDVPRRDLPWLFGLGLCAGLGFWNSLTSAYLILPALLWAAPFLIRGIKPLVVAAAGLVIGAAPALRYMFLAHGLPIPDDTGTPTTVAQRLRNLAGPVFREYLGVTYPHAEGGAPGWIQTVVVALVVVAFCIAMWRRRGGVLALVTLRKDGRRPVDLLLVAPIFVVALYVSSSAAWYTGTPRYLLTTYPLLAIAAAALLPYRGRVTFAVSSVTVTALASLLCLGFFLQHSIVPTVNHRDAVLRKVADTLVDRNETQVFADYWTGTWLQYVAGERLDVAVYGGLVRFPDAQQRVSSSPRPVYVGSTLDGTADAISHALTGHRIPFHTTRIDFVEIFDGLDRSIQPPTVGL